VDEKGEEELKKVIEDFKKIFQVNNFMAGTKEIKRE